MGERVRVDLPARLDQRAELALGQPVRADRLGRQEQHARPAERAQDGLGVRVVREVAVVERDHDRLARQRPAVLPAVPRLSQRDRRVAGRVQRAHLVGEHVLVHPQLGVRTPAGAAVITWYMRIGTAIRRALAPVISPTTGALPTLAPWPSRSASCRCLRAAGAEAHGLQRDERDREHRDREGTDGDHSAQPHLGHERMRAIGWNGSGPCRTTGEGPDCHVHRLRLGGAQRERERLAVGARAQRVVGLDELRELERSRRRWTPGRSRSAGSAVLPTLLYAVPVLAALRARAWSGSGRTNVPLTRWPVPTEDGSDTLSSASPAVEITFAVRARRSTSSRGPG